MKKRAVGIMIAILVAVGMLVTPNAPVFADEEGSAGIATQSVEVQEAAESDADATEAEAEAEATQEAAQEATAPQQASTIAVQEVADEGEATEDAVDGDAQESAIALQEANDETEEDADTEEDSDEPVWIYINGSYGGNDSNDGTEASKAVKTWAKAIELLGTKAGGIYVVDTVTVSNTTISTPAPDKQVVRRAPGADVWMFKTSGEVSFKNIVLDGESNEATTSCVWGTEGTLNVYSNTTFKNFNKSHSTNYSGGAAIYLRNGTTLNIDGGNFLNNRAHFGGAIYRLGVGTINIRAGLFEGNSASGSVGGAIYCSQSTMTDNVINLYNAVLYNNTAKEQGGAIENCNAGQSQSLNIDGAGIFDNAASKGKDVYTETSKRTNFENATTMLGGGTPNWTKDYDSSQGQGWASTPSEADKANAIASATTIFRNNSAYSHGGAIRSNGTVNTGRTKAALEIQKVDQDYRDVLIEGMTFELYKKVDKAVDGVTQTLADCIGDFVKSATSNNNGTLTMTDIETGSYILKEAANAKYIPGMWELFVDTYGEISFVTKDGITDRSPNTFYYFRVENERATKKDVKISKENINGKEIAGATLTITGKDVEGYELKPITWESDGNTKTVKLDPGTYTLHEEGAPDGYIIASDITFTLDADGKVTIADESKDKVTMIDEYKDNTVKISKTVLGQGTELAGAALSITGKTFDGAEIKAINWTSDGKTKEVTLPAGTYTLTENQAPLGYDKAESITFTVDTAGKVKVDGNEVDKVVMEDDTTKYDMKISKTDLGGTELPGATIQVKDAAGKVIDEWTSTDEAHIIKLPFGDYTMTEVVAPEGYDCVTTEISFTVAKDGQLTVNTEKVDNGGEITWNESGSIALADAPTLRDVKISKTDLGGTELPGATIQVKDASGKVIDEWTSTEEAHIIKLPFGEYTMTEVVAPEGYDCVTTDISFTVAKNGDVTVNTTEVKNGGKISQAEDGTIVLADAPTKYDVKISKTDLGGTELPGAVIKVTDADGNLIELWTSTEEAHTIALPFGDYVMTEVVAPMGYDCVTTEISFTVAKDGTITVNTTEVDNGGKIEQAEDGTIILSDAPTKYDVKISKTDLSGTEVAGAIIQVTDADGKVIDQWTSTKEAHVVAIPFGTYTMREVVAPEGYQKITTDIQFRVNRDGSVDLLTATVNGGEVEKAADGTLILKDAAEEDEVLGVGEETPGDDTPEVKGEGTTITNNNTTVKTAQASVSKGTPVRTAGTPKTDDSSNALGLALLALAAGVAIVLNLRRKEN